MAATDFSVVGSPAVAKQAVVEALEPNGVAFDWLDQWTATAYRGSRVTAALFRRIARCCSVRVLVRSVDGQHSVIRLEPRLAMLQHEGVRRRLPIGLTRLAERRFGRFRDELAEALDQSGILMRTVDA